MAPRTALKSTHEAPSRRLFLGAAAALLPACATFRPEGMPRAVAVEVPPERKGGGPAPNLEALLSQMTVDEKLGQMTQADKNALKDGREISRPLPRLGAVGRRLAAEAERAGRLGRHDRSLPEPGAHDPTGHPALYGVDAVHGHGGVQGRDDFPHHIGMGATRSPELVEAAARVTAREVAGTGIQWTFAPCIAVARDERWGRTYESFGETPELAESLGAAAIRGFQDAPDGSAILACAKHYLGDGGTAGGKDRGDTRVSEEELRRLHLPGYLAAIKAGVGSMMVSFASWNGVPMHSNRQLLTDLLKGELGWGGFLVTDWAAIDLMKDYSRTSRSRSTQASTW